MSAYTSCFTIVSDTDEVNSEFGLGLSARQSILNMLTIQRGAVRVRALVGFTDCIVFLGKTLFSRNASLDPSV